MPFTGVFLVIFFSLALTTTSKSEKYTRHSLLAVTTTPTPKRWSLATKHPKLANLTGVRLEDNNSLPFPKNTLRRFLRAYSGDGDLANEPPLATLPRKSSPKSTKSSKLGIAGMTIGLIVLILAIIFGIPWCSRRVTYKGKYTFGENIASREIIPRAGRDISQNAVEEQAYDLFSPKKYSLAFMKAITNNFDPRNEVGVGGFARVYRAYLDNNTIVAVKRLTKTDKIIDDFKNEVEALGRTIHFNLVKLIGYCAEGEHKMLVYEYMINGSLDEWIFGKYPEKSLTWAEKKRIILGVAEGLVYLHENCDKKIIHRDLKPGNILLDKNKNAKLGDFGISKLLERDQTSTDTVGMGTVGYIAPEVGTERVSEKADVFSFGISSLEVVFGKRYQLLSDPDRIHVDSGQLRVLIRNLPGKMRINKTEIESIGKLALLCLKHSPEDRPKMSFIVSFLKREAESE